MLPILAAGLGMAGGSLIFSAFRMRDKKKAEAEVLKGKPASQVSDKLTDKISDKPTGQLSEADKIQIKESIDDIDAKRSFNVSVINTVIATSSILFSPARLLLVSPILLGFNVGPIYSQAFDSAKKKRADVAMIDAILTPGMVLSGYIYLAVIADLIYFSGFKLIINMKRHSKQMLQDVFGELPSKAWVVKGDVEIEVPIEEIEKGDTVSVNAGSQIPVDGTVISGHAVVDQHALTGESQPAEKEKGSPVFAATVVLSGKILIRVEKSGSDTTFSKISDILSQTIDHKTAAQSRGEKIANDLVLPVLIIGAAALPLIGVSGSLAILRSDIGDNMRIIGPLSTLSYLQISASKGFLIKDGRALENLSKIDTFVFDKTGTLTQEVPQVNRIYVFNEYNETQILKLAGSAEQRQSHPVAQAILNETENRKVHLSMIDDAHYEVGYGIKVRIGELQVKVGSQRFMEMEKIELNNDAISIIADSHKLGYSLVFVAVDDKLAGCIELRASLGQGVDIAIKKLLEQGHDLFIVSGDHDEPTKYLANSLGIENYFAEILPRQKAQIIEELKSQGRKVCFIGDGINDSIALKKADVSISLNGASAIATDTAQVLLMENSVSHITEMIEISKKLDKNLNNDFLISIIPGIASMGGVFILGTGVVTSSMFYLLSLGVGVGNSLLPMIQHKINEKNQ